MCSLWVFCVCFSLFFSILSYAAAGGKSNQACRQQQRCAKPVSSVFSCKVRVNHPCGQSWEAQEDASAAREDEESRAPAMQVRVVTGTHCNAASERQSSSFHLQPWQSAAPRPRRPGASDMIKSGAHTAHPSLETVNAQDVQKKKATIYTYEQSKHSRVGIGFLSTRCSIREQCSDHLRH